MFNSSQKDDPEFELEQALSRTYPEVELLRFESTEGRTFQLDGVFALLIEEEAPHWLVVSRGFRKLFVERGEDTAPHFELTCRLPARTGDPNEDFGWIVSWMQELADYLAERGTTFEPFHNMKMLDGDAEALTGLVFVADVVLPPVQSGEAKVFLLQMLGLTSDEFRALESWQARPFVELVRTRNPLFLSYPRASLLRDPDFARKVEEGSERDGSSMGVVSGVELLWFDTATELQLHLSVEAVGALRFGLQHRLRHGQRLMLFGDSRSQQVEQLGVQHAPVNAVLVPAAGPSRVETHGGMTMAVLRIPPHAIQPLLDAIQAEPGSHSLAVLPGVRFVIAPRQRLMEPTHLH